jgi:uncharacterized coiled-coil protein SlyX
MSDTVMNLYFCDLCNESIPQADLDLGRAVRRNERLICVSCEAAMSGGVRTQQVFPVEPPAPRALPSVAHGGSPLAAVALAFASVALVTVIGGGIFFYWRSESQALAQRSALGDLERAAPEHARTVSAALASEVTNRESEIAGLRMQLQAITARVGELEQEDPQLTALARRVDKLEERLGGLDDLASRVQHQSETLDELATWVQSLLQREPAREAAKPAGEPKPPAKANAPTPPQPAASNEALLQKYIADLSSPDSGTRWQAVQSLGGTRDPAVVPHLVPMLRDSDIFVRMAACRHLGDLGAVEAIPALIDTLEDEEVAVREAALSAVRGLSGQSIPFDPGAKEGERAKRVKAWRDWWEQASKELLSKGKGKSKG